MKAVAKLALGAFATLCLAGGGSALADTFTFSMIPSPQTVAPGGSASVDIYLIDSTVGGTQLADENGLFSATFDINRTAASAGPADITSVTANPDFDGGAAAGGSGPSGSVAELRDPILDATGVMPGPDGVFLGSFAVTVPANTASGSTTFTISAEPLGFTTFGAFDVNGNPIVLPSVLDVSDSQVTFNYTGNSVINAAPLPATAEMGMGIFALVGLLAIRRRRAMKDLA
jgi:hypothetical protein